MLDCPANMNTSGGGCGCAEMRHTKDSKALDTGNAAQIGLFTHNAPTRLETVPKVVRGPEKKETWAVCECVCVRVSFSIRLHDAVLLRQRAN